LRPDSKRDVRRLEEGVDVPVRAREGVIGTSTGLDTERAGDELPSAAAEGGRSGRVGLLGLDS
jgi:hypothetical protein